MGSVLMYDGDHFVCSQGKSDFSFDNVAIYVVLVSECSDEANWPLIVVCICTFHLLYGFLFGPIVYLRIVRF